MYYYLGVFAYVTLICIMMCVCPILPIMYFDDVSVNDVIRMMMMVVVMVMIDDDDDGDEYNYYYDYDSIYDEKDGHCVRKPSTVLL